MMKSHPYASKRRLTNICCLIVSFGLIKFVFATYMLAGGETFEFTSERELSPKASIIAQEQSQRAMDSLLKESLAQANVNQDNLAVHNNTTQNNNIVQNNNIAQANLAHNGNSRKVIENTTPFSHSRVSFLPKSQKRDVASNVVNNVASNVANNVASNISSAIVDAKNSSVNQTSPALASHVDGKDTINNEIVFAKASSVTANTARAQSRANLLQNAFSQYKQDDVHALEGVENQTSNYVSQGSQLNNRNATAEKSSSFFSFVGSAHAAETVAEKPYIRPDENLNMPIPAPKVSPYSSPESLEYKQSELNRKEEELIALQQQMNSRMEELSELEGRIGSMVQDANSAQSDKFQHLISTYTSMKAKKAAETLVTLEEAIAVRILNGMKPKQSGEIFSYMDSIQAARLSEAMAELNM